MLSIRQLLFIVVIIIDWSKASCLVGYAQFPRDWSEVPVTLRGNVKESFGYITVHLVRYAVIRISNSHEAESITDHGKVKNALQNPIGLINTVYKYMRFYKYNTTVASSGSHEAHKAISGVFFLSLSRLETLS